MIDGYPSRASNSSFLAPIGTNALPLASTHPSRYTPSPSPHKSENCPACLRTMPGKKRE
jgi:hypothetical protein